MNTNNIMTQVKNLMINIKLRVYYYIFKYKNYFVIIVLNVYGHTSEEESCHTTTGIKYCVVCVFNLLVHYNLYTNSYPGLYMYYKLLLTISVTQVSCELGFPKLKCIKTYLRSTLTQDH